MLRKLLLAWAFLPITVQGLRMHTESFAKGEQSELDGAKNVSELDGNKSVGKVNPWQALMVLLLAFNPSPSEAFQASIQSKAPINRRASAPIQASIFPWDVPIKPLLVKAGSAVAGSALVSNMVNRAVSRAVSTVSGPSEAIEQGAKVRVLRPESYWFQETGIVAAISTEGYPFEEAERYPVVVRFGDATNGWSGRFALDELVEVEALQNANGAAKKNGNGNGAAQQPRKVPGSNDGRFAPGNRSLGHNLPTWQRVGTEDDFNNLVDTVSAANLVSPTGEWPGLRLRDGISGTSSMLVALATWFQDNPEGVVALPLGPDGFTGEQGLNTMFPQGMPLDNLPLGASVRPDSEVSDSTADISDGDSLYSQYQADRLTSMNLMLLGGAPVPVGWVGGGFVYFFAPTLGSNPDSEDLGLDPGNALGLGPRLVAKNPGGDDVSFNKWLSKTNELKSDPNYLIMTVDKEMADYTLNALCTHLGCVVPWDRAEGKFICPCRSSQYDATGKLIQSPSLLSLALAHVDNADNKVTLSPLTTSKKTSPWSRILPNRGGNEADAEAGVAVDSIVDEQEQEQQSPVDVAVETAEKGLPPVKEQKWRAEWPLGRVAVGKWLWKRLRPWRK